MLLARTRMLWTTYANQIDLGKLHLRDRPLALLREATGLDLDDIAALTVAYHGYIRAHQPGQRAGVDAFAGIPIARPIIEAYPGLFASTRTSCRPSSTPARLPGRCCRFKSGRCCG